MIVDDVCARIEELLPTRALELDIEFDVRWGTVPVQGPNGEQGQMVLLSFLFACKSLVLGAPPLFHVETMPITDVVGTASDRHLDQVLIAVCETFRNARAQSLQVGP